MIELMVSDQVVTMSVGEFVLCVGMSVVVGAIVALFVASIAAGVR